MTTSKPPVVPLRLDQRPPAMAPLCPVLIRGPGGSGKTHTIAARIAIWLKDGAEPSQIACLTHSTGSREDIMERVRKFLAPDDGIYDFFVGTPQEFAVDLLRSGGLRVLGRPADFTAWDSHDARDFLAVLLGANPRNRRRVQVEAMRILRWHWLNQAGYPDERTAPDDPEWPGIVELYQNTKVLQNVLDQGDVIGMATMALEQDRDFQEYFVQNLCRHLLVDDFQDITPTEYGMVKLLTGPERAVTVAANRNQCRRTSEGADDRLLEAFTLEHSGVRNHTHHLEDTNVRSTRAIAEVVNRVTTDPAMPYLDKERFRDGRPSRVAGRNYLPAVPPQLLQFEGRPADMYRYILDKSEELVEQGYSLEDMACVVQDVSVIDRMRPMVVSRGIPYTVLGVEPPARDWDVRCITGLLRSVLNPNDVNAFVNGTCFNPHLDSRWLDWDIALRIAELSVEQHIDLVQAAGRFTINPMLDAAVRRSLQFFVDAWDRLYRMLRDPSTEVEDLCWCAVALLENAQNLVRPSRWKAQVQKLLVLAQDHSHRSGPRLNPHDSRKELNRFLDNLNRDFGDDPLALENNDPFASGRGLTFSTVAASQGLQWRVVWAVGASDYILPGSVPPGDGRRMREAQRLFYVWSTRARDLLIYCHTIRSGPTQDARPSPFLDPIGHLLNHEVVPAPEPRGQGSSHP